MGEEAMRGAWRSWCRGWRGRGSLEAFGREARQVSRGSASDQPAGDVAILVLRTQLWRPQMGVRQAGVLPGQEMSGCRGWRRESGGGRADIEFMEEGAASLFDKCGSSLAARDERESRAREGRVMFLKCGRGQGRVWILAWVWGFSLGGEGRDGGRDGVADGYVAG